jgi:hypothetical protein
MHTESNETNREIQKEESDHFNESNTRWNIKRLEKQRKNEEMINQTQFEETERNQDTD